MRVVSYGKTTSNHNDVFYIAFLVAGCILWKNYIKPQPSPRSLFPYCVVSYGKTTSNHNFFAQVMRYSLLYLMEKLHQTTTNLLSYCANILLYLMEKLHQTTTISAQQCSVRELYLMEKLHQTTTFRSVYCPHYPLYLMEKLHQTTTCSSP